MTLPAQPTQADRTRQLVNDLLDRGYARATQQTFAAIARSVESGALALRLKQLDAEAARLAEAGERLAADNPVLRAALADLEAALRRDAAQVDAAAPAVQEAGASAAETLTRQLALPGMDDPALEAIGLQWNRPDPDAVASLVDIANRPAWADEMARFSEGGLQTINDVALRGIVEGWGPRRIARAVREAAETIPMAQANNLMRTLQLTSYRRATALHQLANADILTEQIRIATLDDRVCLCCIALHGSRLPVGQEIVDHHQGRCTPISVVVGRPRFVQTGEAWLRGQPEARQLEIMGHANFHAWQAGAVQMQDFVQPYDDPAFGAMVREASLVGVLGEGAKQFYAN